MDTREAIEFVGVQAALVSAGLHLVWGFPRALVYLRAGQFSDPRPFLFLLSALAVVLGVTHLYYRPRSRRSTRTIHGLLLGALLVYLLGYVAWHVGGHPTFGVGDGPLFAFHYHADDPVAVLLDHLANDAFALANAAIELLGIAAFAWLLLSDRGRRVVAPE